MWVRTQRLLVTIPIIIFAGGAVICAFDYANSRYLMRRDIGAESARSLSQLASETARLLGRFAPGEAAIRADQALSQIAQLHQADRVAVVDRDGNLLASHESPRAGGSRVPAVDAAHSARQLMASGVPAVNTSTDDVVSAIARLEQGWKGQAAFLLVQRDERTRFEQIDGVLVQEFTLNMVLVLVVSGMMALRLRSRLLLPTSRLAATAERIASGDRTARVGMTGHDEVSRAAQAFDRMADKIAATELALEAERRKVMAVLEILPVGVIIMDRDSRHAVFANARWRELFGIDVRPGDDVFERLSQCRRERMDGTPVTMEHLAAPQALRLGRPVTVSDVVHVREDGTRIPHVVHAVPVRLGDSCDFDAVVSVTLDRRELVELLDEVRSWERRYEKVAAATGQIVFEWDLERRTVRRSGSSVEVIGHEAFPDLDTEWTYWREHVHVDDRDRVTRYLTHKLETGESFDEEYRFRHGRGHWIILRDRGFFEFENGRPVRMYGTMDDVTEQRALEEQLRQAQKMETVGTLAGGIAHDFNNALTGVIGHLDLAGEETPAEDPRGEHIRIARQAAQRCAELTRGLLAFSRQLDSHPRPTNLEHLVRESVELLRRMLPSTVRLEVAAAPGLPAALVDPVQVQQVLFNLCINARDAMPNGGRIRVRLGLVELDSPGAQHADARPGRHLELTVEDTGCGITAEIVPRIFEPFFTTKPVGSGTGLGLAMAYGIVRKHHGWIEVESTPEVGTRFRVYLPATIEPEAEAPAEARRSPVLAHGETVLVADDEPVVRGLAVSALRGAGFHVLEASDGEMALRAIENHPGPLALAVLDLMMPGRSGGEVYRELQARSPGVPVVFSSGFTATELSGLESSAVFLPKPWTSVELIEAVRAAMGAPAL